MTTNQVNPNQFLALAGALSILAGGLYWTGPSETVNAIVGRLGLMHSPVGFQAVETSQNEVDVPTSAKSRSRHASSFPIDGNNVPAEKTAPATAATVTRRASSPAMKTELRLFDGAYPEFVRQSALKVSSIEGGHLIERYFYPDGRIVLLIDGHVTVDR